MRSKLVPSRGPLLAVALLSCLLPALVAQRAGPRKEVFGRVQVYAVDSMADHTCSVVHMLEELDQGFRPTGAAYKMRFMGDARPKLKTGDIVLAYGDVAAGDLGLQAAPEIAIDSGQAASLIPLGSSSAASASSSAMLVILCDFQDKSLASSCDVPGVDSMLLTGTPSVNGLYQETSYGIQAFHGDVAGPYTIPYDEGGSCDYNGFAAAADAAAVADGYDLSAYRHKVYVLPNISACSWAGLGTIGGNPSRAWVKRCDLADVFAHELGHNLGMMHAGSGSNEYADKSCFMGYGGVGWRQLNAPHKIEMGWMPSAQHRVLTTSALHTLAPLEAVPETFGHGPDALQVLEIPAAGGSESYYLSYRVPYGLETNLRNDYAYQLNIHRWAGDRETSWLMATLEDGESYTTPDGAVITQLGHTSSGVTVAVDFGATLYPGNGADCAIEVQVDGNPSAGTAGIHSLPPGSTATFNFLSPGGTLNDQPFAIVCSVFTTGSPPAGIPQIGLWIDPGNFLWLLSAFDPLTPPGSVVLTPGGLTVGPMGFDPSVSGNEVSLMLQVLTVTGGLGISDGVELSFQ